MKYRIIKDGSRYVETELGRCPSRIVVGTTIAEVVWWFFGLAPSNALPKRQAEEWIENVTAGGVVELDSQTHSDMIEFLTMERD